MQGEDFEIIGQALLFLKRELDTIFRADEQSE